MITGHETTFITYDVVDWQAGLSAPANLAQTAIAVRLTWDDEDQNQTWVQKFEEFLAADWAAQIPAFIVGHWTRDYGDDVSGIVAALVQHKQKLPNLRALFIGDIESEENEISWIEQSDLSALWPAFPHLEHLKIRGGNGLRLGALNLPRLQSLRIESGGLPGRVVREIGEATLPELRSLVLWLGEAHYGATTSLDDLQGYYHGNGWPKLTTLGLCNSDIQDQIAEFMATAPILQRLETLDLSMGTLSDEGALALLSSPYVRSLQKLILNHHFCSEAMMTRLREVFGAVGVALDLTAAQEGGPDDRFVEVGE